MNLLGSGAEVVAVQVTVHIQVKLVHGHRSRDIDTLEHGIGNPIEIQGSIAIFIDIMVVRIRTVIIDTIAILGISRTTTGAKVITITHQITLVSSS